ncbi:MAG: thermonuclease family protein [Alphaproteobacteria bacterium]
MNLQTYPENGTRRLTATLWYLTCVLAALIPIAQTAFAAPADRRLQGPVQAVVERVIDGDTLAVRARIWLGQELRVHVRIARIDTPELTSRCSHEREAAGLARDFIHTILYADGQSEPAVWLNDIDQDKYGGRVLARVTVRSGGDIAQALVQAGLARIYDGKKRADWCRELKL